MSVLRRIGFFLLAATTLLTLFVAMTVWSAFSTDDGARFLLRRLEPALSVAEVRGRALGPLELRGVELRAGGTTVSVDRLRLDWQPWRLIGKELRVTELVLSGARLTVAPDSAPEADGAEPRPLPRPTVPLRVVLDSVLATELAYVRGGEPADRAAPITLDTLLLRGSGHHDVFRLDTLSAAGLAVAGARLGAAGRATLATRDAGRVGGRIVWDGRLGDGRRLGGALSLSGDLDAARVRHVLRRPTAATLTGVVRGVLARRPTWTAELELPEASVAELLDRDIPATAELRASASGDLAGARGTLDFGVRHARWGAVRGGGALGWSDGRLEIDSLALRHAESGGRIGARGTLALAEGPAGRMRVDWDSLRWPPDTVPTLSSPRGSLTFAGEPDGFTVVGRAAVARATDPLRDWSLDIEGRGDADTVTATVTYAGAVDADTPLRGRGALRLTGRRLHIDSLVTLLPATGSRVRARGAVTLADSATGDVRLDWRGLAWPLRGAPAYRSPDGRLELRGGLAAFDASVDARVEAGSVAGRVRGDVAGAYGGGRVGLTLDLRGTPDGMTALTATGGVALAGDTVEIDGLRVRIPGTGSRLDLGGRLVRGEALLRGRLDAGWRELRWPLGGAGGEPDFASASGNARYAVTAADARILLQADFAGRRLPPGRLRIAGSGGPDAVVFDSIRVETLDGTITGTGTLQRVRGLPLELELEARALNPGVLRPDWPGSLGFTLGLRAGGLDPAGHYAVELRELSGTLRGREVDGRLSGRLTPDTLRLDTLALRSGKATVTAAGTRAETWSLGWQIEAPILSDLVPTAAGRLAARGTVTGPRDAPRLAARVEGGELVYQGHRIAGLHTDLAADTDTGGTSTVELLATGIESRGVDLPLDSVRLTGEGTRGSHRVALDAFAGPGSFRLEAGGALRDSLWDGTLRRLALDTEATARWTLEDTVAVRAAPGQVSLDPLCWRDEDGRLCVEGRWQAGTHAEWTLTGSTLPLAFFDPLLPGELAPVGTFSLTSSGGWAPGGPPRGTLEAEAVDGRLRFPVVGGDREERFDRLRLRLASDTAGLRGELALALGALGTVEGTLDATGAGPLRDRPLDARLSGALHSRGLLSDRTALVEGTDAHLHLDLRSNGTVGDPAYAGTVRLENERAYVLPAGIELRDLAVEATGERGRPWRVTGGVRSDSGSVALDGAVTPPDSAGAWSAELGIDSDGFLAFRTGLARVVAAPALEVRGGPEGWTVGGSMGVPRAALTATSLGVAVPSSPDVVIVGAGAPAGPGPDRGATSVRLDVRVALGEDVTVDAAGLRGRLTGAATVRGPLGGQLTATGDVSVVDAEYRVYGQTFAIDRGTLIYTGSPLGNPGLDIRIVRETEDATVGMNVRGTVNQPDVRLFSNPGLPDEQILARLLTGGPLDRLGGGEGRAVHDMAQSIGVRGGNLVLARLGALFGLESARIEQSGEGTGLALGTQLLPRLTVGFSVQLKGGGSVLRLSYDLGSGWSIQTQSGTAMGADLLYTLEP